MTELGDNGSMRLSPNYCEQIEVCKAVEKKFNVKVTQCAHGHRQGKRKNQMTKRGRLKDTQRHGRKQS